MTECACFHQWLDSSRRLFHCPGSGSVAALRWSVVAAFIFSCARWLFGGSVSVSLAVGADIYCLNGQAWFGHCVKPQAFIWTRVLSIGLRTYESCWSHDGSCRGSSWPRMGAAVHAGAWDERGVHTKRMRARACISNICDAGELNWTLTSR